MSAKMLGLFHLVFHLCVVVLHALQQIRILVVHSRPGLQKGWWVRLKDSRFSFAPPHLGRKAANQIHKLQATNYNLHLMGPQQRQHR